MPTVYDIEASDLPFLLDFLKNHLPKSLPIYRRIQHPNKPENCKILCTIPLGAQAQLEDSAAPFAVAWLARTTTPEVSTAGCLFSSLELDPQSESENDDGMQHLLTLLEHFRRTSNITSFGGSSTIRDGRDVIKVTCLDANVRRLLRDKGVIDDQDVVGGPYSKFLIDPRSLGDRFNRMNGIEGPIKNSHQITDEALPTGMEYDTVRVRDFDQIVANNPFVTNAMLPHFSSAAIRAEDELLAWAFIKYDGSVGALYCMPQARRQGLARKVVQRLLQSLPEYFHDRDSCWCHTDIEEDNTGSIKLFESLGAVKAWKAYWSRIHLERVSEALGERRS